VSHGGDVWGFSRKYNVPLEKVLDFSGPTNFLGPSPKAVEAVKHWAKLIRFYPDPNPVELRTEIAKYVGHGVGATNIILGNGSIELIYMISDAFACGFKAIIPVPSFTVKKYVLITIVTLGVGIVYWLYKIINMYNAHFKAQREIEKEIIKLMEEKRVGESV